MRKFVSIEKLPSGNYSVRYWKDKKFEREWFADYDLARRRKVVLEGALLSKRQSQPYSLSTPAELLKEYVNDPEANDGEAFAEMTKQLKLLLGKFLSTVDFIPNLTTLRIKSYLNSIENQTTRSIRYRDLHAFCEWCLKKGYLKENPFNYEDVNGARLKINKPKPAERDTKLSPTEIQKLLDTANSTIRLRLLHIALTGKRKSEVLLTEWQHLDLEKRTWFIPKANSKSRRDSTIPLPIQLAEEFKKYQAATGHIVGKVHPRNNLGRELHLLAKKAGVSVNVTPHVFRHSFASCWRGSPQVLMGLLGWTSPIMIQRYTHLNAEDMRHEADSRGIAANLRLPR